MEWAHAMAPGATILLVEASSASLTSLFSAVDYAVSQGASAISMSWGTNEFLGETTFDSHFTAPGVTFTASSGDSGPASSTRPSRRRSPPRWNDAAARRTRQPDR